MERDEVLMKFRNQSEISFSKGYKIFEEVYEDLKDILNLKRKEIKHFGWTEVIITKGE